MGDLFGEIRRERHRPGISKPVSANPRNRTDTSGTLSAKKSNTPRNGIEPPEGSAREDAETARMSLGFDKQRNIVLVVALAVVVTVRPRELNFLRLLPFLLPLLALSLLLASRTATGLRSVLVPLPVLLTIAYFMTTCAWSGVLNLSIAESIVVCSVAATAALVGSFATLRDLVGGVLLGCFVVLVVSVVVGVAFPGYGLISDAYQAGSLRGIMLDRNSLSFVLLVGIVAALSFDFRGRSDRAMKVVTVALLFGGVIWTASSTCLILSTVAILLAVELAMLRRVPQSRRGWAVAGGVAITSLGAMLIVANFDELLRLVDRDPSLTGRTRVWPAVEKLISQHPWLGQGWGAVWGNEAISQQIARSIGFFVPHAHNGYLDVQVQVGAIGLALVLLVLLIVSVRGVGYYLRSDSSLSSWALILSVVLVLYNRVETSFSAPSTMFLMFATLVVLEVSRNVEPRVAQSL